MKQTLHVVALIILIATLGVPTVFAQTPESMPYFNSFENTNDTAGWIFKKRPRIPSEWYIGTGAHRIGEKGLYVSSDGGVGANYAETGSGYSVVAYRKFTLAPGTYDLSFDTQVGGEGQGGDAMRVGWMPTSVTPTATSLGATFPTFVTANPFVASDGTALFEAIGWTNFVGTITVTGTGATADYYLAFVWKTNGGSGVLNPGSCIDNIQIAPVVPADTCHAKVTNITTNKAATDLVVSWQGNATTYELIYFNTTSSANTAYTHITNIVQQSYSIPYNSMPEGVYSFRVRAICGADTSIWMALSDVLHYDPSAHCLDYLNFTAQGVVATTGTFGNPYGTVQVVDNGPDAQSSRHTYHYRQGETDLRTLGGLKTVPDGEIASVRLGNWNNGGEGESITYSLPLDKGSNLMLYMKYAIVLEAPGHGAAADPRFTLEIMNAQNQLLDAICTKVDFYADAGVAAGWNTSNPEGYQPVVWKDWTSLGVNLSPYAGQTVKIRLTTVDCDYSAHFGYAYFTLDCAEAKITGLACGEIEVSEISAPDGFNYRWYKPTNPSVTVSRDQDLHVDAADTATYHCDVIFKENPGCKFTLTASLMPRSPFSEFTPKLIQKDCKNYVVFENTSHIVNDNGATAEKCESFYWDFGNGMKSQREHPDTIPYPSEGGVFNVELITGISRDMCTDTLIYEMTVPPTGAKTVNIDEYICEGTSVTINGKQYSEVGEYSDTLKLSDGTGCDSIMNISISVLVTDTILSDTTICDDQSIVWFGQDIKTTGEYTHSVKSVLGCDSLYYIMTATINEALDLDFGADTFYICADDIEYSMPYVVNKGNATGYKIKYSAKAEGVGFVSDKDTLAIDESTPAKIIVPTAILSSVADETEYIETGYYQADVTFYNSECGNVVYPVVFGVEYPSFVIAQRWNDVLAMKNEKYNGGYKFASYQWYKNSGDNTPFLPIAGETKSILYTEGEDLDFNADYRLSAIRMRDGMQINTCAVRPVEFADEEIEMPDVTFNSGTKAIVSSAAGVARIYTSTGALVVQMNIQEGETLIDMTLNSGVYILNVIFEDGNTENTKIIVR